MAQVLKESQREKILASALNEFCEKGQEQASMRTIAKNAQMTVGNLYRYYPGKEELLKALIRPALEKINEVIISQTDERVSLFSQTSRIGFSKELIRIKLMAISEQLIPLVQKYPRQMQLIMQDKLLAEQMRKWLANLIIVLANEMGEVQKDTGQAAMVLSDMVAAGIISGMHYLFRNAEKISKDCRLDQITSIYLQMVFSLLERNVKEEGHELY